MTRKLGRLSAIAGLALAGATGTSQAVNIATDGIGEVAIGSYYTAQPGYFTLVNLTNTQNVPIAVKVRIHEARNSRDVLDFTVTLSAFDVFVGLIREVTDSAGNKQIVFRNTDQRTNGTTGNPSCTVPQSEPDNASGDSLNLAVTLPQQGFQGGSDFPLSPNAFGGNLVLPGAGPSASFAADDDGGPTDISRLREGYIEIISMGYALEGTQTYDGVTYTASASDTFTSGEAIAIGDAIENHQCNRVQTSFGALSRANGGPARILDTARQMGEPINALKATFQVVNFARGVETEVPSLTFANFYNGGDTTINPPDPTADLTPGSTVGVRPGDNGLCTDTRGVGRDTGNRFWVSGGAPAKGAAPAYADIAGSISCNNLITKQVPEAFLEPTLNDTFPAVAQILLDGPNASFALQGSTLSELGTPRGIDAISALLQRSAIINEWVSNDFAASSFVSTTWVVTMPTKLFYVDPGLGPQAGIFASFVNNLDQNVAGTIVRPKAVNDGTGLADLPYAPFVETFGQKTAGDPTSAESCIEVGIAKIDRAENIGEQVLPDDGVSISPAPPKPQDRDDLCYEVNVVDFDGRNALGHVALANDLNLTFPQSDFGPNNRAGWVQLDLNDSVSAPALRLTEVSGSPVTVDMFGAPVTSFVVKERFFNNASLNYMSSAPASYLRDVRDSNGNIITGSGVGQFTGVTGQ